MKRWSVKIALVVAALTAFPSISPAPLIYRPDEGWVYEKPGKEGKWTRTRAKDQLELAEKAFEQGSYGDALKGARRVIKAWPLSDYAPQAQYLVGRCYEARKMDEKAFKEYQKLIEKYPKIANYDEVIQRQHDIARRYLNGQRFKVAGHIPLYRSMEKTSDMLEKTIKNGPYSEVAPQAQMDIGTAHEKQKSFGKAVKAYESAADRYHDRPEVAADALYRAGLTYYKQAREAEYDQNAASLAITTFTDFMTLFPNDGRVAEAQKLIGSLKYEQARGAFQIAQYYEKKKKYDAAQIYYNEVLLKDPASSMAVTARMKIEDLKKHTGTP